MKRSACLPLLLTAVLLHPSSDALWAYTGLLPHYLPTRIPLTIKVLPAPEAAPVPEPAPAPAPDEALLDTLRQSFAWRSPRAPLQKIPAKVSVSAVATLRGLWRWSALPFCKRPA